MRRDSLADILNEIVRGIKDTGDRLNQVNGSVVEIKAELNSLKGIVRDVLRDLKDRVSDAEKSILNNVIDRIKQFEENIDKEITKLDNLIEGNYKGVMEILNELKSASDDIQTILIEMQNNLIENIKNSLNYEETHILFLDEGKKRVVNKEELKLGKEYVALVKLRGYEKSIKIEFNGEIEEYLTQKVLTVSAQRGDKEGNYLKLKFATKTPEKESLIKRLFGVKIEGYYKLFIDDQQIEISPVAIKKTKTNIITGILGTIIAAIISISGIIFRLFDNLIYSLFGISTITVYFLALIYLLESMRR